MGWGKVFGCERKIISAPMGPDIGGPKLVAAAMIAGGTGFLRVPETNSEETAEQLREAIRLTRQLAATATTEKFGVEVVLEFPFNYHWDVIKQEKVEILGTYWGYPSKDLVDEAHACGMKVVSQIGTLKEAKKCIEHGVDALIVQGKEAGGHVRGQESLFALVPKVRDAVGQSGADVFILAAGAIVDGRGYVAALGLGADGVSIGTRFVATEESYAHPRYKQLIVELDKTEYQNVYGRSTWPNSAQRILSVGAGPFFKRLPPPETDKDQPVIGKATVWGAQKDITYYSEIPPNETTTGEIELMALYCGEGVGLITEILTVQEVMDRIVSEGKQILAKATI